MLYAFRALGVMDIRNIEEGHATHKRQKNSLCVLGALRTLDTTHKKQRAMRRGAGGGGAKKKKQKKKKTGTGSLKKTKK